VAAVLSPGYLLGLLGLLRELRRRKIIVNPYRNHLAMLAIASFSVSAWAQAPTSPLGFALSGSLHDARASHTATLLNDGRVLVAGGGQGPDTEDGFDNVPGAELFDPVSGSFTPAGTFSRQSHTATLLSSGKVMLAGGEQLSNIATSQSELYDPVTGQFGPNGGMVVAREGHTATLLPDGRVLMVGGFRSPDGGLTFITLADAEIYNPATGSFSLTGSLNDARSGHTATLLPNGKVLIAGGSGASAELYDPATGVFTRTGSMSVPRSSAVATLLLDGHVLITGDEQTPELYDPATGSFALTGNTLVRRQWHTATLLQDGTVLLVGGENPAGVTEIQSEIYDPAKHTFTAGPNLNLPRVFHTATSLPDGTVAVIGGAGLDSIELNFFNSAEIYGPVVGSISASPNPCVMSSALWLAHCTTYLTWSTSGISNAQVWVKVGNAPETNFANLQSCGGTDCPAPWIEANTVYTFTLYNCDAADCTFTGHTNARAIAAVLVTGIYGFGSISASPNPCVLLASYCTTYLTWSTDGISNAQVWVRVGNAPETNFATGQSCGGTDCAAPWIEGIGTVYTFTLYNCDDANCTFTGPRNARSVASVQVTGINGSPPRSEALARRSVMKPYRNLLGQSSVF
jgi:Galactose oxidase, central domain